MAEFKELRDFVQRIDKMIPTIKDLPGAQEFEGEIDNLQTAVAWFLLSIINCQQGMCSEQSRGLLLRALSGQDI